MPARSFSISPATWRAPPRGNQFPRYRAAPDAPTFAESGVAGYDATSWFGISAPAGLPVAIVERLSRDIRQVIRMPDVSSRLTELGFAPGDMTADQYQAFVRAELLKWSDLVKRAGIPVQ